MIKFNAFKGGAAAVAMSLACAFAYSAPASAEGFFDFLMPKTQPQAPAQTYQASYGLQQGRSVATDGTEIEAARPVAVSTAALVQDPTAERAGTITIDTKNRVLYLSMANGEAMRYGIGVGRDGFRWSGTAHIQRKAEWPSWTPPAAMLKRRPDIPHFMKGGIENPLGARAMYLFNGKGDTGFRIHGTNEPDTIGQAVSSGCIRMMNQDVIDLYQRVKPGTKVIVLPG